MSANFVDVMLIDADTISFVMTIFPQLRWSSSGIAAAIVVPLLALFWWLDPVRVRLRIALAGRCDCFVALSGLSFAVPMDRDKAFDLPTTYRSSRAPARSRCSIWRRAAFSNPTAPSVERLAPAETAACKPGTAAAAYRPGARRVRASTSAPCRASRSPGLPEPFPLVRRQERTFLVEGAGGPTWFTEYNVLSGLSVRSFGHFADFVTRIAAGRVTRSLPNALRNCGYRTYSVYPARCFSQRPQFPEDARHRSFRRRQGSQNGRCRAGRILLRLHGRSA